MVNRRKPQEPEPTKVDYPPHVPANRPESWEETWEEPPESGPSGRAFSELEALAPVRRPPGPGQVYVSRRHEVDRYDELDEDARYADPGPPQDPYESAEPVPFETPPHHYDGGGQGYDGGGHFERDPRGQERHPQDQERHPQGQERGAQGQERHPQGQERGTQGQEQHPHDQERDAQGPEQDAQGQGRGAQGRERDPQGYEEPRRHEEEPPSGGEVTAPEEEWDTAPAPRRLEGDEDRARPWERYPNDRWVVGDAGNQPAVRPRVPHKFRNPPPDTVIDGAEIGSISYRAASVRGISHQERGEPRQDAYAVHFTRDQDWLVGCISDGVSQGTRSHEAAAAICERISRALVDHLIASPPSADSGRWPEEIGSIRWKDAVRSANAAVCELARPYLRKSAQKRGGPPPVDPAEPVPFAQARLIMSGTALAFVVATEPSPNGTFRAMLANVAGDSAAFVVQDGHWLPLTMIKNEGEAIFSSSVKALPADTPVHAKPFYLEPGQPLIMMTDGLGDPLGAARGAVSRFLGTQWHTPPDLLAFAQHLAFYRKTFTDDRTAVVVWPGPVRSGR